MATFEERLRTVFADTFETHIEEIDENISIETSRDWDSMRSIVLASSLEDEFDIEFTDEELVTLNSYGKIRSALLAKGC